MPFPKELVIFTVLQICVLTPALYHLKKTGFFSVKAVVYLRNEGLFEFDSTVKL